MHQSPFRDASLIMILVLIAWAIFAIVAGNKIMAALLADTGEIAWVMAFGSFIAGATCLGGGAVAFPALTKFMGVDPFTAKSFALAIQSIGMSAASLFIIVSVRQLPWRLMSLYLLSSLSGLTLSLTWLDRLLAPSDIRIGFTLFSLSFLCVFILANQRKVLIHNRVDTHTYRGQAVILGFGLLGGVASGLLGSGADLLAFCVLAIYFRLAIRTATQVSVLMMAINSIVGFTWQTLILNNQPEITSQLWFAAAPVVILGAPIGALICKYLPQKLLFGLVVALVTIEVVTTLWLTPIEAAKIKYYAMLFIIGLTCLFLSHWFPHKHAQVPSNSTDT